MKGFTPRSAWIASSISVAALMGSLMAAQQASAHGYIAEPASRSALCNAAFKNLNQNCGHAQYEPQSVGEGRDGFPGINGVADGQIASGMNTRWAEMDVQTASRWHKSAIQGGDISFTWFYSQPHATADWKYYITKQNWNPNAVLSRDQFELTPFCEVDGKMEMSAPGRDTKGTPHACTLPADRTGHHVVMGVWDVGDTSNSFHSVIDVEIEGAGVPPADGFKPVAAIAPNGDLKIGDKVRTRMFDKHGASLSEFDTEIAIENAEDMLANVWGKKLAVAINDLNKPIKAGVRNSDQEIVPQLGRNELFAKAESGVVNMELAIDRAVALPPQVQVSGLQGEYKVKADEVTHVDFKVQSQDKLLVEASLYDAANKLVGDDTREGTSAGQTLSMDIAVPGAMAKAGEYTLMLSASIPGKPEAGITQVSKTVKMIEAPEGGGEYDFVYPEGISNYQEGTRVLAADGKIYAAKPFPFLGWAKQNNAAYKPGTGFAWADAWDLVE